MVRLYSTRNLIALRKKKLMGGGVLGQGKGGRERLTCHLDVILFLRCHGNVLRQTKLTKTASNK